MSFRGAFALCKGTRRACRIVGLMQEKRKPSDKVWGTNKTCFLFAQIHAFCETLEINCIGSVQLVMSFHYYFLFLN